jgi:CRISPR-associated endoribonuclease Cas6
MKLHLGFNLKELDVNNDYRYTIVSLIKKVLSDSYVDDYNNIYSTNNIRSYTFSAYFPNCSLNEKYISVPSKKMFITLTAYEDDFILKLYNSFLKFKFKSYPLKDNQVITLNKVRLSITNKIEATKVVIKFLSPLLVRKHIDDKDYYLSYKDGDFNEYLNYNTVKLAENLKIPCNSKIQLTELKSKITVVKSDDLLFQSNIGTFILEGDNNIINMLYKTGMGSKRGLGFGMFEVLGGINE